MACLQRVSMGDFFGVMDLLCILIVLVIHNSTHLSLLIELYTKTRELHCV